MYLNPSGEGNTSARAGDCRKIRNLCGRSCRQIMFAEWLKDLWKEASGRWLFLIGLGSNVITFFLPGLPAQVLRDIGIALLSAGFLWANFNVYKKHRTSISQSEQEIAKLDTEQTQKRKAVKNHLAQFLKEGQDIQQEWEYSNLNAPQEKKDWENRAEAYLKKELGESYAVRFRGPTLPIVSFPADMNPKMRGQWGETTAKIAMLNDFISELPN